MLRYVVVVAMSVALSACATVQEQIDGLDVDIDAILEEVRDCDGLADRLVDLARTSAHAVDDLAARGQGRVPETTIRETVDKIAVSRFFELAERIGCTSLEFRIKAIEDLTDIATETESGQDLIDEILRDLEASTGP